jgi:hypothetical protein
MSTFPNEDKKVLDDLSFQPQRDKEQMRPGIQLLLQTILHYVYDKQYWVAVG